MFFCYLILYRKGYPLKLKKIEPIKIKFPQKNDAAELVYVMCNELKCYRRGQGLHAVTTMTDIPRYNDASRHWVQRSLRSSDVKYLNSGFNNTSVPVPGYGVCRSVSSI